MMPPVGRPYVSGSVAHSRHGFSTRAPLARFGRGLRVLGAGALFPGVPLRPGGRLVPTQSPSRRSGARGESGVVGRDGAEGSGWPAAGHSLYYPRLCYPDSLDSLSRLLFYL